MRSLIGILVGGAVVVGSVSGVWAERVIAHHSSWDRAHARIHTDLIILGDDGLITTRRVPGGVVGDVGMRQFALYMRGDGRVDASRTHEVGFLQSASGETGALLRWEKSCVYITPDAAGTSDVAGDGEFDIIDAVIAEWGTQTAQCSYLDFVVDAPAARETVYDGFNVIKFREDEWCRPASEGEPRQCYDSAAAAITTVFYVNAPGKASDGLIRDADVEMNAVDFAIGVCSAPGACTTDGQGSVSDLANTLTHEIGHLVGLDHTCWDQQPLPNPVDDQGVTVPNCFPPGSLTSDILEATMYNFQDPGEVKKASISPDDAEGFCGIYAAAADPGDCSRALAKDDGICAVVPPGERGERGVAWAAAALATLAAAAFSGRARRRT